MDKDMLIFLFTVPLLALFTIIGVWAYLSGRADDKRIHQLALEAKRKGVKPLDDY
jgi:hypothetical protein